MRAMFVNGSKRNEQIPIEDLPSMLPTTFSVHLAKRFQRIRFLEIDQLETRIVYGSHIC
jgi:hypothetical protein